MPKLPTELLVIRGAVASLPPETQDRVQAAAKAIHALVDSQGDIGAIALSLVVAEVAHGFEEQPDNVTQLLRRPRSEYRW